MTPGGPLHAEAQARLLAARDYRREGVEMFLALEDLRTPTPSQSISSGAALAEKVRQTADQLTAAWQDDPVRALRVALEIVARLDFGDAQAPPPRTGPLEPAVTGVGRKPLRLPPGSAGAPGLVAALRAGRFVRSVNFHNTLAEDRDRLDAQLSGLASRFVSIGLPELTALVSGAGWPHDKPPLLLVFYEGLRNHFDVAAPLLEARGQQGVFCLIPGFIDTSAAEQVAFARQNYVDVRPHEYPNGRVALTWAEARVLAARGHSFVCHTMTHADPDAPNFDARRESVAAVERMERELGREVTAFVWRRGLEWGGDRSADALVSEAGVRLLISNFRVQHLPGVDGS